MASNKGEWAELYTALKLLAEGKLYLADSNGEKNLQEYMRIIELIRHETERRIVKYNLDPNNTDICIEVNKQQIKAIPVKKFDAMATALAQEIQQGKGRAFDISKNLEIEIKNAEFTVVKAKSIDKSDIFVSVVDPRTSIVRNEIGFSIKSEFSSHPSTLFNTSRASAVIYKLSNMNDKLASEINSIFDNKGHASVSDRCAALLNNNCNPEYVGFATPSKYNYPVFQENLDLINPRLPKLIETIMFNYFFKGIIDKDFITIVKNLVEVNPHKIKDPEIKYSYMIKSFIYACYCGLTASTPWNGKSEVNGGFIQVTKKGDVLAYYAMESDSFKEYLFNHCYLDLPSTDRQHGDYGYVYKDEEDNDFFFKLNFQIRYK